MLMSSMMARRWRVPYKSIAFCVIVAYIAISIGCDRKNEKETYICNYRTGWHGSDALSMMYVIDCKNDACDTERLGEGAELCWAVFYRGYFNEGTICKEHGEPTTLHVSGPDLSIRLRYRKGDHFWINEDGSVRRVMPMPTRVYQALANSKDSGAFDEIAFEKCRNYEDVRLLLLQLIDVPSDTTVSDKYDSK